MRRVYGPRNPLLKTGFPTGTPYPGLSRLGQPHGPGAVRPAPGGASSERKKVSGGIVWADGEGFRRMVRPLFQSLTTNGRRTEPGTIGGHRPALDKVRPMSPVGVQATPGGVALHQH